MHKYVKQVSCFYIKLFFFTFFVSVHKFQQSLDWDLSPYHFLKDFPGKSSVQYGLDCLKDKYN